jgi:multidrug efflux pump subunit AcrB
VTAVDRFAPRIPENSILLIDFIEIAKKEGAATREAIRESVRIRTRPILMTAFATAVRMIPIALEQATELERLSPWRVVATFLTLLYVPIFYAIFADATSGFKRLQSWSDITEKRKACYSPP